MREAKRLAAFAVILIGAACSGLYVRDKALLPPMLSSWPAVRAQAVEQAARSSDASGAAFVAAADVAFAEGTPESVAEIHWPAIRSLAVQDIHYRASQGEIGPGVSMSLMERIKQFGDAIASYTSRVQR